MKQYTYQYQYSRKGVTTTGSFKFSANSVTLAIQIADLMAQDRTGQMKYSLKCVDTVDYV